MEDAEIIALYFRREEAAIAATAAKYGAFCLGIAQNILSAPAEAEECVNDAYWRAWNAIPPQKPDRLGPWLGRVVRNLAYDRYKASHRQKRYAGMQALLCELEDCIPAAAAAPEQALEAQELTAALNRWLAALPADDRVLFVRRYWNGEAVKALAQKTGVPAARLAKRLYRLRQGLKAALEQEGYIG